MPLSQIFSFFVFLLFFCCFFVLLSSTFLSTVALDIILPIHHKKSDSITYILSQTICVLYVIDLQTENTLLFLLAVVSLFFSVCAKFRKALPLNSKMFTIEMYKFCSIHTKFIGFFFPFPFHFIKFLFISIVVGKCFCTHL